VHCAQMVFGAAALRVDFADDALHTMLGIDDRDEAGYALIELGSPQPVPPGLDRRSDRPSVPQPPPIRERSGRISCSADLAAMHAAAAAPLPGLAAPPTLAESPERLAPAEQPATVEPSAVPLPAPTPPVLTARQALHLRTSNGPRFSGQALNAAVLAAVLDGAMTMVRQMPWVDPQPPEIDLYCAVSRVPDVAPGWYRYRPTAGELVPVGYGTTGSPARMLREALRVGTVNVELAAFTVHIAGPVDVRASSRGARAHRVGLIAVGAAIHAVTLAATTVGAGNHPLLGIDAVALDMAYGLANRCHGVQAQVSVGAVRPGLTLEGSVIG
jgi:hypothetical protein